MARSRSNSTINFSVAGLRSRKGSITKMATAGNTDGIAQMLLKLLDQKPDDLGGKAYEAFEAVFAHAKVTEKRGKIFEAMGENGAKHRDFLVESLGWTEIAPTKSNKSGGRGMNLLHTDTAKAVIAAASVKQSKVQRALRPFGAHRFRRNAAAIWDVIVLQVGYKDTLRLDKLAGRLNAVCRWSVTAPPPSTFPLYA